MNLLTLILLFISCQQIPQNNDDKLKIIHQKFKSFPKTPIISPVEAMELNDKKTLFIDVRENEELSISKIKGAVTKEEFEKNIYKYTGYKLIVYCTIGFRSAEYTQDLIIKGFNAKNLLGGVLLWSHHRGKFYRENIETKDVHVYSRSWNFLHADYRAKY